MCIVEINLLKYEWETFDLADYFIRNTLLIQNFELSLCHTAMNQLVASYVVRLVEILKNDCTSRVGQTRLFMTVDAVVEFPLDGFPVSLAFPDADGSGFGPLIYLDRQH